MSCFAHRAWQAAVLTVLFGCGAAGCARVAPYERERLAHPTMSMADLARPSEEHMRSVHEGAVGGGSSVGGGCGCN